MTIRWQTYGTCGVVMALSGIGFDQAQWLWQHGHQWAVTGLGVGAFASFMMVVIELTDGNF